MITALLVCIAVIFFMNCKSHEGEKFLYAVPLKMESGWGYKIYAGTDNNQDTLKDRIYIRQENVPGIPGKHRFTSKEDALRVANLVIWKISSGIQPIIAAKELDSLGIAFK
jgi:hypothetical protein